MSDIKRRDIVDKIINEAKLDLGVTPGSVNASSFPVIDDNNLFSSDNIEEVLSEIAGKLMGLWNEIYTIQLFGNSTDVTDKIENASINSTPITSFADGPGIFVDQIGHYDGGNSLPSDTEHVTQYGMPGYVRLRSVDRKDPIDNGEGHEIYGILFYDLDTEKYFLKYYTDSGGIQYVIAILGEIQADIAFSEVYQFSKIPPHALCRTGYVGFVDSTNIDTFAGHGLVVDNNILHVNLATTGILEFQELDDCINIKKSSVDNRYIDFGTSGYKVNAASLPIVDGGELFASNNVEDALVELYSRSTPFTKVTHQITQTEINNGYFNVAKAIGNAGEKQDVNLTLIGCSQLDYGLHYTAMNNDVNNALSVILKQSGVVSGITSPVYPSAGIQELLLEDETFYVMYQ